MVPGLLLTRRVLAGVAVVAAAAGTTVALWPLHGGGDARASVATAAATRGDIVLSVGGVGRIVEAGAAGQIAVPASAPPVGGSTPTSAPSSAPADAVFPSATGHVVRFLVTPGRHVRAGDPIAVLDDGSAAAIAIEQARSDMATARLELRQKQTSDPANGLPPLPAELRAARLAVQAANDRARLVTHPSAADRAAVRLDVVKARAELDALTRKPVPAALTAAQLAVDVAAQRLSEVSGAPAQIDVSTARLELSKAQADLDTLRQSGASATAVQAGQLAVTLAQQRIAELPPGAPASDVTAAQLELKKAQADLEVLQRTASASGIAAAQAAVDLADQKLALLTAPSPATVATAQLDLAKAQAELQTLERATVPRALEAAGLAVKLALLRATLLLHPTAASVTFARADAAKAAADLGTLRHRGAPAGPNDIAIARLKVQAAEARLRAARLQAGRLTVRAPAQGTVTSLLAVPGSPADPSTPIATVADLNHLAVAVDLSEFDIAKVRRGQSAVIAIDALGGKDVPGRVVFVALTGTDNGGVVTFPVRVELEHAAAVKPGMNVSVRIVVAERDNVVRVPLEAVAGNSVTVVGSDGKEQLRHVAVGLADNKQVEIRSGLRPGERVALVANGL
jgi:HlyD family secretion protein